MILSRAFEGLIHRTPDTDAQARMKEVVDMTLPFRTDYHISYFLHACCFVHAVFCRYLDGFRSPPPSHSSRPPCAAQDVP